MKKNLILFACLCSIFIMNKTYAANNNNWGAFLKNVATSAAVTDDATTKELNSLKSEYKAWSEKLNSSETNLHNAFINLVSNLSSQKEATKIKNNINNINTTKLTVDEKNAQIAQIILNYSTNLQNSQNTLLKTLQTMQTNKKEGISKAVAELKTAMDDYTKNFTQGSTILKKIAANPKLALNMTNEGVEINQKLQTLNTNLNSLKNITSLLTNLSENVSQ